MSIQPDLATEYVVEHSKYSRVAETVANTLRARTRSANVSGSVEWRAKDPWSLATKLVMRARRSTPYATLVEIPELAGVRVVIRHLSDLEAAKVIIRNLYPESEEDDKSAVLNAETFRYRGIHFQVFPEFADEELQGLGCEIQLRTSAEHLWSDLSHELFYKTPGEMSDTLLRRFNRLVALVELFDTEVDGTMKELEKQSNYYGRKVLEQLESQFKSLVPNVVGLNRDLSLEVIASLSNLDPVRVDYDELAANLVTFVETNFEKLTAVYRRLALVPGQNPFYMQPESLLLWYLMENSKYDIKDEWLEHDWDLATLEDLSIEWGITLPE